jgi:hypothetical protein
MQNFKTIEQFKEYISSEQLDESVGEFYLDGWLISDYAIVSEEHDVKITLTLENDNRPIIGNTITISFPELNTQNAEAKVDTGAEMSCLHAEDIKFNEEAGSVSFVFDGKRITMNCAGSVDIQTADHGLDKRPIVKLQVVTDQGTLNGVDFNLNDRSEMPHQILLGKSFLQAGDFLIDPLQDDQATEETPNG